MDPLSKYTRVKNHDSDEIVDQASPIGSLDNVLGFLSYDADLKNDCSRSKQKVSRHRLW